MTSLFHQFCYQGTKTRTSYQTWLSQNPTKINSFCNQTFHTSFWMHLWQFPTKIAPKPWLYFFSNVATKAQKLLQATKLGKAKTQLRSIPFATKLFDTSFWMHLGEFPTKIVKNHDFTFSPSLLPSHQKPIQPTWLSKNSTKINSFCNQTFNTTFCIHLWQFPTKIAQTPWLHFFTNFATKA